ncbi:MAG: hypothetical protein ACI398_03005 [Clostridium sp.]
MKAKKGSLLIEASACIFILSLLGIFTVTTCLKCRVEYEKRIEEDKADRIVNMIVKEIKYNIPKSELDELLDENNKIGFKYKDDLIKELQVKNLLDIERGRDIEIEKESEGSRKDEYIIRVNISKDAFNVEQNYKFQKSWWMDEI